MKIKLTHKKILVTNISYKKKIRYEKISLKDNIFIAGANGMAGNTIYRAFKKVNKTTK